MIGLAAAVCVLGMYLTVVARNVLGLAANPNVIRYENIPLDPKAQASYVAQPDASLSENLLEMLGLSGLVRIGEGIQLLGGQLPQIAGSTMLFYFSGPIARCAIKAAAQLATSAFLGS